MKNSSKPVKGMKFWTFRALTENNKFLHIVALHVLSVTENSAFVGEPLEKLRLQVICLDHFKQEDYLPGGKSLKKKGVPKKFKEEYVMSLLMPKKTYQPKAFCPLESPPGRQKIDMEDEIFF